MGRLSAEERERLHPYLALRRRFKEDVGMSFYDRAANWLDQELARERDSFATAVLSMLYRLLEDEKATRRTLKADLGRNVRNLIDKGISPKAPGR